MLLMSIPGISFAMEDLDFCTQSQSRGSCYFGSYSFYSDPTLYFNCETNESTTLEISSEGLLITGFKGAKSSGKGILKLNEKTLKKTLNKFYFEVHRDTSHVKMINKIEYTSDKDIHCEIGKKNHGQPYPGPLD